LKKERLFSFLPSWASVGRLLAVLLRGKETKVTLGPLSGKKRGLKRACKACELKSGGKENKIDNRGRTQIKLSWPTPGASRGMPATEPSFEEGVGSKPAWF
jgi:hypothetical protein